MRVHLFGVVSRHALHIHPQLHQGLGERLSGESSHIPMPVVTLYIYTPG